MYRFQNERRHGPIWRVRSKKPCPNDSRHDLAIFQSAADSFLGTAVKTQRNIYEKVPTEAFKHRCEKTGALFFGEKTTRLQRSHIKSGYMLAGRRLVMAAQISRVKSINLSTLVEKMENF